MLSSLTATLLFFETGSSSSSEKRSLGSVRFLRTSFFFAGRGGRELAGGDGCKLAMAFLWPAEEFFGFTARGTSEEGSVGEGRVWVLEIAGGIAFRVLLALVVVCSLGELF